MNRLLLIVDPQIDFINGSLPVPGAGAAMDDLAAHVVAHDGQYAAKVVTCDFHPHNHCSFSINGGQWPEHCVAHSIGAAIWPVLLKSLYSTSGRVDIICKGQCPEVEEYSLFQNRETSKRIESIVSEMFIEGIDICGLAGDICVLHTLRDGVKIFGSEKFHVLQQFSPSIDGGDILNQYVQRLLSCAR